MRAYSFKQINDIRINLDNYTLMEQEGVFEATLDCKCWGKKRNILAYLTLHDGRKVMTSAWQNTDYLGIPEIPIGALIKVTFQKAKNGISYLRNMEMIF